MNTIKILLADDHAIIRESLREMLNKHDDLEVVAEAENGRIAVELALSGEIDIIIMDISMPDLNGIEAAQRITSEKPEMKIIALSVQADKRYVLRMLEAGASGYLLKDCGFNELKEAIITVAGGRKYLSPEISDSVIDGLVRGKDDQKTKGLEILTLREKEVLQLLAEGCASKEIADKLAISHTTVDTHRKKIMDKLQIHNWADLIKFAIREGLTEL